MAEAARVFDNAYTVCAVCTPARASLQTGVYPSLHGMGQNLLNPGCIVHELADGPHLLSRRLGAAGASAGFTGKWHLGFGRRRPESPEWQGEMDVRGPYVPEAYHHANGLPTEVGYRGDDFPGHGNGGINYPEFQNFLKQRELERQTKGWFSVPSDRGAVVTSGIETTNEFFLTERTRELIEEMRSASDQSWCMQLNYWGPHIPYFPTSEYYERYRNVEIPKPSTFDEPQDTKPRQHAAHRADEDWSNFERGLRHYYAYTTMIDAELGRLFDWLRRENLYNDTWIIFTSDHGDSQGCHGRLRNKAFNMYEEVMGIPLIVKPPRSFGEVSRRCDALVHTCDLHETMIDCVGGGDGPSPTHGKSILPLLREETNALRDTLVSEGYGVGKVCLTQRMCVHADWKYVWNLGDKDELYHLLEDPAETRNLAVEAAPPPELKQMRNRLGDWMKDQGDRAFQFLPAS